jgi:hypothetical protein
MPGTGAVVERHKPAARAARMPCCPPSAPHGPASVTTALSRWGMGRVLRRRRNAHAARTRHCRRDAAGNANATTATNRLGPVMGAAHRPALKDGLTTARCRTSVWREAAATARHRRLPHAQAGRIHSYRRINRPGRASATKVCCRPMAVAAPRRRRSARAAHIPSCRRGTARTGPASVTTARRRLATGVVRLRVRAAGITTARCRTTVLPAVAAAVAHRRESARAVRTPPAPTATFIASATAAMCRSKPVIRGVRRRAHRAGITIARSRIPIL